MVDVVESENAVRRLDRVDTREDLKACLKQLYSLIQNSFGEACTLIGCENSRAASLEFNRCDTGGVTNAILTLSVVV